MKKQICAVLDTDHLYVSRLAEYMQSRNSLPFDVFPFTREEKLLEFCKDHPLQVLLTGTAE